MKNSLIKLFRDDFPQGLLPIFTGLIGLVFAIILFFDKHAVHLDRFLNYLTVISVNFQGEFGALCLGLSLGLFAFALSRNSYARLFYAASEIYFGVLGSTVGLLLLYKPDLLPNQYQKLIPEGTKYAIYAALVASVFVTVRGLNNGFTWASELRKHHKPD